MMMDDFYGFSWSLLKADKKKQKIGPLFSLLFVGA
jgi:hypothetical protein